MPPRSCLVAALLAACGDPKIPPCETGPGVKLNEAMTNPEGADEGGEWVELFNAGSSQADLTGWRLTWRKSASSTGETDPFPEGTVIPAGGFLVVGEVTGADVAADLDLGQGTGADGLSLEDCGGEVVDTLVYGDADNSDGIGDERETPASSVAEAPSEGDSLGRCPDGEETDRSGDDFEALESPSPGEANCGGGDTGDPSECEIAGVVLNDLLPDPDGADEGGEWVELYNTTGEAVDLSGASIEWWKSASSTGSTGPFPEGTVIDAYGFLLVGPVSDTGVTADLDLGNGTGGDGVHLVDCDGETVDAVVYGDSDNADEIPDETGEPATSVAEMPPAGDTLSRCPDGEDHDRSADDFTVIEAKLASPGTANDCPPPCDGAADVVLTVNEAVVNPEGTDDGQEWLEVHNAGTGDASVGCWSILVYKSPTSVGEYALPRDAVVPAGGHYLVAGSASGLAGDAVIDLDLGNGSGGDAIHLVDGEGAAEDALVYGEDNSDGVPDETGAAAKSQVAGKPADDECIVRFPDGEDSGDLSADARICAPEDCTPGASNVDCATAR